MVVSALLALLAVTVAGGQSADLYAPPQTAVAPLQPAPPLRLAESARPAPLASLERAAVGAAGQLQAVQAWNRAGRLPARIGFVRPLPLAPRVTLAPPRAAAPFSTGAPDAAAGALAEGPDGSRVWGGEVRVDGAHRLRLRLTDLALPPGSRMWVYGEGGDAVGPFGLEVAYDGALWTPSVAGPAVRLEVEVPVETADGTADGTAGAAGFRVAAVAEILHPAVAWPRLGVVSGEQVDTSCLIDVQCVGPETFPVVDAVERAIAHLQIPAGEGFVFVCTGGLLNDTADSGTPYLLTANHCLDDQADASGLEAFWDLKSDGCEGNVPDLDSVPRTSGSTLVASGVASDYTLVRMNAVPPNRVFLGWNANPAALQQGTVLHRVHHPVPEQAIFTQTYSRHEHLPSGFNLCGSDGEGRNFDDPNTFLHGRLTAGGSFGGSSGAPLIRADGQVVGQLFGGCGPDPDEGCDPANQELDGAFSASFAALEPFLVAGGDGGGEACEPDATTLCLNEGRFRVRVNWRTRFETVGDGKAVQVTPTPDDSGLFYFFNNPDNWEMLVKVLDGCPVTGHYWVFFAATTNVEFTLTVIDTQEPEVKLYFNPLGQRANAVTDTMAFATCP